MCIKCCRRYGRPTGTNISQQHTDLRLRQDDFPSLHHNMQYSLFCQWGVCDRGPNVHPRVHRPPPNNTGVSEWAGFTRSRTKEQAERRVSRTNQNICFVKFTFTDCLAEFPLWKIQLKNLQETDRGLRLRKQGTFDSSKGAASATKRYNKPTATFFECLYSPPPQDC